jgi:hypothetical protein
VSSRRVTRSCSERVRVMEDTVTDSAPRDLRARQEELVRGRLRMMAQTIPFRVSAARNPHRSR